MITYVGPGMSVRTAAARADATGTQVYVVGPASDKASLLASFAQALQFPHYFGGNYDALADCLSDLSWLPAGPKSIIWDQAATLRARDSRAFAVVDEILAEVEAGRADLYVAVMLT